MVWNLFFNCHKPVEIKGQQLNKHPNYHNLWGIHEQCARRHSFVFMPGCALFKHSTNHQSIWNLCYSRTFLVNGERGLWAHYTEWRMAVPSNVNSHYKKRTYITMNIFILTVMHLHNFKIISQVGQIGQNYQANKLYWTAKKQNNETEQPINWKFSSLILEQSLIVCFIFFNSVTKYFLILSCNLLFTSICPCLLGSRRKKILIPFHEQALTFTYKKPPMSSIFLPFFRM